MSGPEKFQLFVYDGDYSLPSMDPECIKSILYTTALKLPIQLQVLNNFKVCVFNSAPNFVHKNLRFRTFKDLVLYLRTLNYNLDNNLNAKQTSELLALMNYVQSKLKPFLDFIYWVEVRNREEFVNVWYMRALPLPFNYWHTKILREKSMNFVETIYPNEMNNEVIGEFLKRSAIECLSSISARLGNGDYFYGNRVTTLDVIVYSYIAPIIKLPFPSGDVCNIISMWPNLQNFVKRIDTAYFGDLPKNSKYMKKQDKTKSGDDDVSYIAILILTVSATSLILGFAYSRGIISKAIY